MNHISGLWLIFSLYVREVVQENESLWNLVFTFSSVTLVTSSLQAGSSCLQFGVRSYLHHFYEECSASVWDRDPEVRGSVQTQRSALWWNSAVWKVEHPHNSNLHLHTSQRAAAVTAEGLQNLL